MVKIVFFGGLAIIIGLGLYLYFILISRRRRYVRPKLLNSKEGEINVQRLKGQDSTQNIPWIQDKESWHDPPSQEAITFDNSQALRNANELALNESSSEEGMRQLREIIENHSDCSAPYNLLAQALRKYKRNHEAEKLLFKAFNKVLKKSSIGNSLGSLYFFDLGDLEKSIEWFTKSILAESPENRSEWGSYLYLSGIYNSYGFEEEASLLKKLADHVRGHPVLLSSE